MLCVVMSGRDPTRQAAVCHIVRMSRVSGADLDFIV